MMDEFICCSEAPVSAMSAHDLAPAPGIVVLGCQKAFISVNPCHIELNALDNLVPNAQFFSLLHLFHPDSGVISTSIDISRRASSSTQSPSATHDQSIIPLSSSVVNDINVFSGGHEQSYDIR